MTISTKKILSIIVSILILCVIYYSIDLSDLLSIFKSSKPQWLAAAMFMFVPTTILAALRLELLSPDKAQVDTKEALRLVLAGSSLNIILPSKMGDIAKGYFITERSGIPLSSSLSIVIYEKTCDIIGLLLWCVFGLFFIGFNNPLFISLTILTISILLVGILMIGSEAFARLMFMSLIRISPGLISTKIEKLKNSWMEMCHYLKYRKSLMLKVAAMSIAIMFMQLLQIWFFIRMLGGFIPLEAHLGLAPLALFAGLVPLTFAGVGTRDAALIFFMKNYLTASVAAALGILCTFRYFVPAVIGLPFLKNYNIGLQKVTIKENIS